MRRRSWLKYLLATGPAGWHAGTPAQDRAVLRWVQLADLTTSQKALSESLAEGAKLVFDEVNARGGVHRQRLELETVDAADLARLPELMEGLLRRQDVFGLFMPFGTAETIASAKALPGWPIFAPFSGADPLRTMLPPSVMFVRQTWGAEVDRLMGVIRTIGLRRVAIVYPAKPEAQAQAVLGLVGSQLKKHGLELVGTATIPHTSSTEVRAAAAELAATRAQVVIVGLAGPAPDFMLAAREAGITAPMYTVSSAVSPQLFARLKGRTRGVSFSSAIPSPWDRSLEIVRQYQAAQARRRVPPDDWSFQSMEGYLNARLLVEILQRAGPQPTRARFIEAGKQFKRPDFGGLAVDLTASSTALSYTDLFTITANGTVMR